MVIAVSTVRNEELPVVPSFSVPPLVTASVPPATSTPNDGPTTVSAVPLMVRPKTSSARSCRDREVAADACPGRAVGADGPGERLLFCSSRLP